jgi:hypothetical protein
LDELRFEDERFRPLEELRLRGTFAPFLRASDSPIAIACFRLVTLPPWPDFPRRSVPRFRRRIAPSTLFPAERPYLRPLDFLLDFFVVAMMPPECEPTELQPSATMHVQRRCRRAPW